MAAEPNNRPDAPHSPSFLRPGEELDPANKSLVDALRLSFRILQGVMVILIGFYLFTGWNIVAEQERGIRLTFGKVRDLEPLDPGGHGSWPYPVGEFIHVRTSQQTASIHEAFWLFVRENEKAKTYEQMASTMSSGLDPKSDGSIITGDGNLAHVRVEATYEVQKPFQHAENISAIAAETLIHRAVERGVVRAAAVHSLDTVLGQPDRFAQDVRRHAQKVLDATGSGVVLLGVTCSDTKPPRAIYEEFIRVNEAAAEAAGLRESARAEARTKLTSTAGSRYEDLIQRIDEYERALTDAQTGQGTEENAEAHLALIDEFLKSDDAAGLVAEIIEDAEADRLRIESDAKRAASEFEDYYAAYQRHPQLVLTRLWSETIQEVMAYNFLKFLVPHDADIVEIRINEDPNRSADEATIAMQEESDAAHGDGR